MVFLLIPIDKCSSNYLGPLSIFALLEVISLAEYISINEFELVRAEVKRFIEIVSYRDTFSDDTRIV